MYPRLECIRMPQSSLCNLQLAPESLVLEEVEIPAEGFVQTP